MTTKTKILLTISLSFFAISTTGLLWGIALPVGAILFGLFMISKVLEKEAALYDEEQLCRIQRAEQVEASIAQRPVAEGPMRVHGGSARPSLSSVVSR
jgi:hypothetical protein